MATDNYVNILPDFEFFKSDYITLPFEWCYSDGTAIDLSRCEARLYLFPFGRSDMPVEFNGHDYKIGIVSQTNLSTFIFSADETKYLDGNKYTYQPVLYCNENNTQYVRGEGHIIFRNTCE